ncbi:MAG: sensor N-terminal transmembrane domain-containing protein, partial [Pseudomonadota bacterium]
MAIDSDRDDVVSQRYSAPQSALRTAGMALRQATRAVSGKVQAAREQISRATAPATSRLRPIGAAISSSWLVRQLSGSIRVRIITSNILGLLLLLFGWIALSQQNIWLIDAKQDALRTQSRIMATAVSQV